MLALCLRLYLPVYDFNYPEQQPAIAGVAYSTVTLFARLRG
jgi:hypothetical protein